MMNEAEYSSVPIAKELNLGCTCTACERTKQKAAAMYESLRMSYDDMYSSKCCDSEDDDYVFHTAALNAICGLLAHHVLSVMPSRESSASALSLAHMRTVKMCTAYDKRR